MSRMAMKETVRSRGWLCRALGLLLLTGCTAADPQPAHQASWSSLEGNGLGGDVEFAVALSSPPMAENRLGYLALVKKDGSTEFLKTGPHPGGPVTTATSEGGGSDLLCATSETTTYELTSSTATKWERGGYAGSGHWGAATEGHGCIVVLNSGVGKEGYETDVYWGHDDQQRHSLVPAVPGPTGLADGAVWVRDAALTQIPGELSLYRTDLDSGETEKVLTWPTRSEVASDGASRIDYDDGYATDLFEHDGRIYYLEDLLAVNEGELEEPAAGENGAQLRLAEIDPSARTYRSSFLERSRDGLQSGELGPGVTYSALSALRQGHVDDGVLYSAGSDGTIVAVDLETKKVRRAARLTPEAAGAVSASAAWHDHEVTLFLADVRGDVTQQTYDLRTGEVTATRELSGFAELLTAGLDLGSAAMR